MFLFVPLLLIFISILGIALIIFRKKDNINKFYSINVTSDPEAAVLAGPGFNWQSYGAEFFPEIASLLRKFKFHEHKSMWLMEAEKLLRRTRLVFLRIDRFSDELIKKIRRIHLNGQEAVGPVEAKPVVEEVPAQPEEAISPAFLKNEEERLILEIAKNPKDPKLYEALGDLYSEMDSPGDAKESYEAAIELNPQSDILKQKLSSALEKAASQN